MTLETKYGNT